MDLVAQWRADSLARPIIGECDAIGEHVARAGVGDAVAIHGEAARARAYPGYRSGNDAQVARLTLDGVLSRSVGFRFQMEAGDDALLAQRFHQRFDQRVVVCKLRGRIYERPLMRKRGGVIGQGGRVVASAAPRRAELRILQRGVGSEEDIEPKQRIRIGGLTRAACRNVLRADSSTGFTVEHQLLDASAHPWMANSVVLHRLCRRPNDITGEIRITLEIAHFAEATRVLEIAHVAGRKWAG